MPIIVRLTVRTHPKEGSPTLVSRTYFHAPKAKDDFPCWDCRGAATRFPNAEIAQKELNRFQGAPGIGTWEQKDVEYCHVHQ